MITEDKIIAEILSRVSKSGTQLRFAQENRISPTVVSDVLNYRRGVTKKLAEAVGYERVFMFRKRTE